MKPGDTTPPCTCHMVEQILADEGLAGLRNEISAQEHVQHCTQCGLLCDQYRSLEEFERAEPGPSTQLVESTLAALHAATTNEAREAKASTRASARAIVASVEQCWHRLRAQREIRRISQILARLGVQMSREAQELQRSSTFQKLQRPLLLLALLGLALVVSASFLGELGYGIQQFITPLLLLLCCGLSVLSIVVREPKRAAGFAVLCLLLVLTPRSYRDVGMGRGYSNSAASPDYYNPAIEAEQPSVLGDQEIAQDKANVDTPYPGRQQATQPMPPLQVAPKVRAERQNQRFGSDARDSLLEGGSKGFAGALPQGASVPASQQRLLGGRLNKPGAYQLEQELPNSVENQALSQRGLQDLRKKQKTTLTLSGPAERKQEELGAKVDRKESARRSHSMEGIESIGNELSLTSKDDQPETEISALVISDMLSTSEEARRREAGAPLPQKQLRAQVNNARAQVENLSTENLKLLEARGYWANNYIPGDPAYQLLANRLARSSRHQLPSINGQLPLLEQLSERVPQPFDAPDFSSLAIYLTSDQTQIQGKTRALLQVGIKASERKRGSRPTMNISLVLDLPQTVPNAQALETIAALLQRLEKERQVGDRFSLVLAGRPGAALIAPGDFRYGTVRVALDRLKDAEASAETLSSTQALARAIRFARQSDDEHAPLGSSVVLFASLRDISSNVTALRLLAHDSAVSGVPVSVITLGTDVPQEPLDELVLAGQGSRRFVATPEEADLAIQNELESLTTVVARALRVRIRLAPNVKLVRVLGSQRLNESRAQEQRQAEQSIDQRVARSIGISADRGEDEDGIQIIIPAFYAGDAHAILLDVLVTEAGDLADVQLRYKDLLNLKNSVARAMLSVPAYDPRPLGALERNVTRNYLAYQLYDGLQETATAVESSQFEQARARVQSLRQSIAGFQPLFAQDQGLTQDLRMLDEFSAVLAQAQSPQQQEFISDALNYAAQRKILQQAIK